jgi:hypothetical protein
MTAWRKLFSGFMPWRIKFNLPPANAPDIAQRALQRTAGKSAYAERA